MDNTHMTQTARREMDSTAVFDGSSEFERIAAALGGASVDSSMAKEVSQKSGTLPQLDHIAQLILEIDSHAAGTSESEEQIIKSQNRNLLAAQIGCTSEDLEALVESYGEQWQEY